MTTISPTRVSMYDFLYQDMQPMISLLADAAQLSLPQTRLALSSSLQAIVSALLAYQQQHQAPTVMKKLLNHNAIKELRHYNSMNFITLNSALYHRQDIASALFGHTEMIDRASDYIAKNIDATPAQTQILLTTLCVIVLRELAILADYSQLDNQELDKWFALQPQFLTAERFNNKTAINRPEENNSLKSEEDLSIIKEYNLPAFDPHWYELTKFVPEQTAVKQDMEQATSHYLKVIGRSTDNVQQGRHNDMLIFTSMATIALPHQRWLLQLAKISDIYLNRNRLQITSEPKNPPSRPLVNLGNFIGVNNDINRPTTSKVTTQNNEKNPLWKMPVIIILVLVLGLLSALATLKYQTQKSSSFLSKASQPETQPKHTIASEEEIKDATEDIKK